MNLAPAVRMPPKPVCRGVAAIERVVTEDFDRFAVMVLEDRLGELRHGVRTKISRYVPHPQAALEVGRIGMIASNTRRREAPSEFAVCSVDLGRSDPARVIQRKQQ